MRSFLFLRTAKRRSTWAPGRIRSRGLGEPLHSAWLLPQSLSPVLCSAHLITVHSVDQLSQLLCPVTELASLQFTQLLEMDHSSQVHVLVEERNQAHEGQALGFGSVYPHCWGMGWGETMLPGVLGGCLWTEKGCLRIVTVSQGIFAISNYFIMLFSKKLPLQRKKKEPSIFWGR